MYASAIPPATTDAANTRITKNAAKTAIPFGFLSPATPDSGKNGNSALSTPLSCPTENGNEIVGKIGSRAQTPPSLFGEAQKLEVRQKRQCQSITCRSTATDVHSFWYRLAGGAGKVGDTASAPCGDIRFGSPDHGGRGAR